MAGRIFALVSLVSSLFIYAYSNFESTMLSAAKSFLQAPDQLFDELFSYARITARNPQERPLLTAYPILQKKIPCLRLGNFPTPIHHATNLQHLFDNKQIYIKRDDITAHAGRFGGNKLRKLEFMLADAQARGYKEIITFGCAGSNHVAATAWYAYQLGMKCTAFIKPQINSGIVRRNLLCNLYNDLHIVPVANNADRMQKTTAYLKETYKRTGRFPYFIPTGASCPLGALGYVNAAFELDAQIKNGLMPVPGLIYVPLGSAGTMVGLLIGLRAAGITSKIIGVTIEPEEVAHEFFDRVQSLFADTIHFLRNNDATFPLLTLNNDDFEILYDHCGGDYALFTQEGIDAIKLLKQTENLQFDGVYSGKVMAGMLADLKNRHVCTAVLFWLTFCSDSFEQCIADLNYTKLPAEFHSYFEQEVQELDHVL